MTIIYMNISDKAAAEQLAELSPSVREVTIEFSDDMKLQGIADDHLTIIDLSADQHGQKLIRNGGLIELLEELGMLIPATVKTIDLLYSDIERKYGLTQEAYDTSAYFRNKYNREVTVRHVSNMTKYDCTLLVSPSVHVDSDDKEKHGWRLYGFNNEDLVNVGSNDDGPTIGFDGFLKIINERKLKPFWEGDNIRDYLAIPRQKQIARPNHKDESPPPEQDSDSELQVSSSEGSVVNEKKRTISPFFEYKESKRQLPETKSGEEQRTKNPRLIS